MSAAFLALLVFTEPGIASKDTRHTLEHGGRRLDLHISTQYEPAMQQNLLAWMDFISTTLLQAFGYWPRQQVEVTVAPVAAGSSDPIPWAQVHRDTVNRVEFFTAPQATTEELKHAWTGYHELAHLLIPYRGWGDAWFSEGLASYYQNVLQARAGILTEQQMWQKLYEGYQRGLSETDFDGQALYAVSDKLRQNGGFMRVYWSGAWYFLAADARLRQQSSGSQNLDQALAKLNLCCAEQSMSVPQMVSKLDELNRVVLFESLYEEVRGSRKIPEFEPIFASMGISVSNGEVKLQQEGPGARLRRQIAMRKPL